MIIITGEGKKIWGFFIFPVYILYFVFHRHFSFFFIYFSVDNGGGRS